jgi:hypothetical protein
MEECLQRGWIDLPAMAARVRRSVGMHGTPHLVAVLRAVASGARSPAERLAIMWLHRARITGWSANVPIEDADGVIGVGDIVFRDVKLVVEIDGRAHHSTVEAFERDRERRNRLVAAGWTVLRFTWRDLTTRPEYVVATIPTNLARLRRAGAAIRR